jgi:hypothetical protein
VNSPSRKRTKELFPAAGKIIPAEFQQNAPYPDSPRKDMLPEPTKIPNKASVSDQLESAEWWKEPKITELARACDPEVATTAPASSAGSSPTTSESSLSPPEAYMNTASAEQSRAGSKASMQTKYSEDDEVAGIINECEAEKEEEMDSTTDLESEADSDILSLDGDHSDLQAAKVQEPRKPEEPNQRILYDKCTIRTWFMALDVTGDGFISKNEFVNWLVWNPNMRKILIEGEEDHNEPPPDMSEAVHMARLTRRVLKYFKEMDVDNNKKVDFKEFLTLFRRAGYLLEYGDSNNPRSAAEKILKRASGAGPVDVRSASQMARRTSECIWYMQQEKRASMEKQKDAVRNRRFSCSAMIERSPAKFWSEEPLVLKGDGGRQRRKSCQY